MEKGKRQKWGANPLTPYGRAVKQAMAVRNLTIRQLAKDFGTNPTYLSRLLRGVRGEYQSKYYCLIEATLGVKRDG